MDLTGLEFLSLAVIGSAVAVVVGMAVALAYKVREFSGHHG